MQHMTNRKQVRVRQRVGVLADGCATFMAKIYSGGVWSKALMSQWGGGVLGDVCRDLIIPMVGDVETFSQPTKELPRGETTQAKNSKQTHQTIGITLVLRHLCETNHDAFRRSERTKLPFRPEVTPSQSRLKACFRRIPLINLPCSDSCLTWDYGENGARGGN